MRSPLTFPSALALALALFGGAPLARAAEYRHPMATKLLRREAYRSAAKQFRNVHESDPERGGPLAGLALCLCHLGQTEEAAERADAAEGLDPVEPMIFDARACLAEHRGDFDAQEFNLERAAEISIDPTREGLLGLHYVRHGLFDEAQIVAERMQRAGLTGRTSANLAIRGLLAEGESDEALAEVLEIVSEARTHRGGMILYTLWALSQEDLYGDTGQPYESFSPATRTADSVLLLHAEASRRLGLLDDAEQQAGRRKQEPNEPLGQSILARIACDYGDLEQAEVLLDDARERWPLHPSPILTEAVLRVRQGRPDEARRLLEMARARGVPAWDRHVEDDLLWELSRRP